GLADPLLDPRKPSAQVGPPVPGGLVPLIAHTHIMTPAHASPGTPPASPAPRVTRWRPTACRHSAVCPAPRRRCPVLALLEEIRHVQLVVLFEYDATAPRGGGVDQPGCGAGGGPGRGRGRGRGGGNRFGCPGRVVAGAGGTLGRGRPGGAPRRGISVLRPRCRCRCRRGRRKAGGRLGGDAILNHVLSRRSILRVRAATVPVARAEPAAAGKRGGARDLATGGPPRPRQGRPRRQRPPRAG